MAIREDVSCFPCDLSLRPNPRRKKAVPIYRLPSNLNPFQQRMYEHLAGYKINVLGISQPGEHKGHAYDVILPHDGHPDGNFRNIYEPIRQSVRQYLERPGIQAHIFFGHLASSQAACFNLFWPILHSGYRTDILKALNSNIAHVTGYEFEYVNRVADHLGEGRGRGASRDVGTDVDLAIFYEDAQGRPCAWLIEHKLTEDEFTHCGGAKSKGRTDRHKCEPVSAVRDNPDLCYYHSANGFRYWALTKAPDSVYDLSPVGTDEPCPFKGSLCQLWRNQLMARAMETAGGYHRVDFSVVYPNDNSDLWELDSPVAGKDHAGQAHRKILKGELADRFRPLSTETVLAAAQGSQKRDDALVPWLAWYEEKYGLRPSVAAIESPKAATGNK